tara:strand:+ start:557 stop:1090 length:534 start_codon:yes stop_codon:yes gene_type:complete
MIEILVVIIVVGLIGSISVIMLSQGSEIFVSETNRQGFVSEARSAFWRIMRDTHGQRSSVNFTSSDQKYLKLKNSKGEQKEFQIESPDQFNYRFGGTGNYNRLSNSLGYAQSGGFKFFNNNYDIISHSSSGLTEDQAKLVHISKLELTFIKDTDILSLSSFVFPYNFRFGQKMSYHE